MYRFSFKGTRPLQVFSAWNIIKWVDVEPPFSTWLYHMSCRWFNNNILHYSCFLYDESKVMFNHWETLECKLDSLFCKVLISVVCTCQVPIAIQECTTNLRCCTCDGIKVKVWYKINIDKLKGGRSLAQDSTFEVVLVQQFKDNNTTSEPPSEYENWIMFFH